jgi:hypothetical protein
VFDRFLADSIVPFLLKRGFRRRQHTFWTPNVGTWTALRFHRNPDDRRRFTIKLLVASERLQPEALSRRNPPRAGTALITTFLEQLYSPRSVVTATELGGHSTTRLSGSQRK